MARKSQTATAVLGALSIEPMTGYALREVLTEVLGHFWHESYGQIYPTLHSLEADGLITKLDDASTSGSEYTITEKGLERLATLLAEPIQQTPPRNALLLRIFFGRHLGPEACRRLIEESRERATANLAALDAEYASTVAEPDPSGDRTYWLLTIAAGRHSARAAIAWADEALETLMNTN